VISHAYSRAGTFLVKAYDGGGATVTASVSVEVFPVASLAFSPQDPRAGEVVTFTAKNFFSTTLVRWDFGDGTIEDDPSPPSLTHVYQAPGNYSVRAYDGGGPSLTASTRVAVLQPRRILYSPSRPKPGETVVFRVENFSSQTPLWDFGDGSDFVAGGPEISHIYRTEGVFNVTAVDFRKNLRIPVSVSVMVYPARGPRALFSISFLSLRFDDGKTYKTVAKDFQPLKAFAELKYEGTGILIGQWLVDGVPFRHFSKVLPYAAEDVLDSGQGPGLPTIVPGNHDVTLKILQPEVDFEIPVVRYSVLVDEPRELGFHLSLSGANRLDQSEIPVEADSIGAPAGDFLILKGTVRNGSEAAVPFALLRIYLESQLVDQRLLNDLQAGEERRFEFSIYNPTAERKKVYLLLYRISGESAVLLALKEILLVPK
jgi:hypothetical protein